MSDAEQGKKFDGDKARTDLLSSKALLQIARVMGYGAQKYGAQNWRKGIAWSRVYAAVQRHLLAWQDGETYDPETGISHLAHAGCGIMFLLEYAETHGELDDRYTTEKRQEQVASKSALSALQPDSQMGKASSNPVPPMRATSSLLVKT